MQRSFNQLQGYEDTRFRLPVEEDLHCGICLNVLNDAVQCKRNEHHFCRGCITRHLELSQFCPACKEELSLEMVKKCSRFIAKHLAKLEIRCSNDSCREYFSLEALGSHVAERCDFSPVVCANNGCEETVLRKDKHLHEQLHCEHRENKCQNCVKLRKDVDGLKTRLEDLQAGRGKNHSAYNIVVVGGRNNRTRLSNVEVFNFATGWTPWVAMDEARAAASVFIYEGQIFVAGGRGQDSEDSSSISVMVMVEQSHWSKFPCDLPIRCSGHTTIVYKDRLFVIGGGSNGVISDGIHEMLLVPPYSSKVVCTMPEPSYFHGCECFGTKVFIMGGSPFPTKTSLSTKVVRYDIRQNECTNMAPLPFTVGCMATARWGVYVVVVGGCNAEGEVLRSVLMYNTETGKSEMLPDMRRKRRGCSAVIVGSFLVVMGGVDEQASYLGSVEAFSFETYTWEELPSMTEPKGFISSLAWEESLTLDQ